MRSRCAVVAGLMLSIGSLVPATARAHRDDYLDETFVYQTLERGEFEGELWAEVREPREGASRSWYTGAFEWGITSRWTLDGAAQFVEQGSPRFGRLRLETRYRFAEEGKWPLDLATSAEYEQESDVATGAGTERTLTPRLVVSRDLGKEFNATVNLDAPIPLDEPDRTSLAYALGMRYPAETAVRVGFELKGQPTTHQATVFPQVWFALSHQATIKVGAGLGLTDETDRLVLRGVFELEF